MNTHIGADNSRVVQFSIAQILTASMGRLKKRSLFPQRAIYHMKWENHPKIIELKMS